MKPLLITSVPRTKSRQRGRHVWQAVAALASCLVVVGGGLRVKAEDPVVALVPANPITYGPGPWINPPDDPNALRGASKALINLDAGWYSSTEAAFGLYPPVTSGVNQGIRARFKYVAAGTADVAVRRRQDAGGVVRSYSLRLDETGTLRLVDYSNVMATNHIERKSLLNPERKLTLKEGDEVLLELIALNSELVAKVNGQAVGTIQGADLTPGRVSVYTTKMKIAGIQWMILDGLTDRKAKAALGPVAPDQGGVAAPPAAAAKMVIPAPPVLVAGDPDVRQRLTEIDTKFRALFEQLAGAAYKHGLEQLNLNYLAALKREEAAAQHKGNLKEVLMYQTEAKAVNAGGVSDEAALPVQLKPMHETYSKALARLEADRDKLSAPAFQAYATALDQYTAELTKAGRIEAAKQVDELHEVLKLPGSKSASSTGTGNSGS